jgi:hypothetical protein
MIILPLLAAAAATAAGVLLAQVLADRPRPGREARRFLAMLPGHSSGNGPSANVSA